MKGVKVAKFGGTSLADANQIKKVAKIVQDDPSRKFIVVSAPGKRSADDEKVTDLLLALREGNGRSFSENFEVIRRRFFDIVAELGVSYDLIAEDFSSLREFAGKDGRDHLVSRGEYICAKIFAAYRGFDFIDAASFVRFNEDGVFDLKASMHEWGTLELSPEAKGFVIPGFYGALPNGKIKTFSRGGSDFSGAVVAGVVGAELYENWTDVSGMFSADPRVVKNPRRIKEITYRELRELTYMGASVLHDEVVFPLKDAGIPILIKNTNAPHEEGTLIVPDQAASPKKNGDIVGIAGRKNFTVITIEKELMNQELGFLVSALTVFKEHGVSVEHVPGSIDAVSVVVDSSELKNGKLEQIREDLIEVCNTRSVKIDREIALICVVGHNISDSPGRQADILTSLTFAHIGTRLINQCASKYNFIFGVDNKDCEDAVRAVYQNLL